MAGLIVVLLAALGLGAVFVALFVAAARSGQFDDLDDAPERMLRE
ncbi:MAG: cbb3-type cytochrome oxidase assembly protein CcoS [Gemmatimonadetes bacterium]|nr:cbb3-type cytochrome oxidase assembly protein CcoS [Gemmatimonadota bacterium]